MFNTIVKFSFLHYYHLHSTVKREHFFAHVYFSNETVSQPDNDIDLTNENVAFGAQTMNVCHRNVARFGHMPCRFDIINDIFQGFGSLVSLRLQKDGAKSKNLDEPIALEHRWLKLTL